MLDADGIVQHLGQRSQAVGGARGVGNHLIAGLEHRVVDAVDDGGIDIFATGGGNDDLLGATGQVRRSLFPAGEQAGAFQHHVHAQCTPGQLGWIALGQHLDAVAIDDHVTAIDLDLEGEAAVRRVAPGQVGVDVGIAQVVDRHHLDFVGAVGFVQCPQNVAADTAIPVDRDLDCHDGRLLKIREKGNDLTRAWRACQPSIVLFLSRMG